MAAMALALTASRATLALPSLARSVTAEVMNAAMSAWSRAAVPARPFQPPASRRKKSSSAGAIVDGSPALLAVTVPISPRRLRCQRSAWRQECASMRCERNAAAAASRQNRIERMRDAAIHREERQQEHLRQLRIDRHVLEPGGD